MTELWLFEQDSIDWQELSILYRIAPLGDKSAEHLRLVFGNSRFKCFVFEDGKLIGAGRALADGRDCSYLCDIVIHPDHQGRGLGKAVVEKLTEMSAGHSKIILYANTGKEGFYRKLGFRRMLTAMAKFADQRRAIESGFVEGRLIRRPGRPCVTRGVIAMVTRRSFMRQLGVAGAAGVYFGETLIAGAAQADVRVKPPAKAPSKVWLDANENSVGPPASAIEAMVQNAPHTWRYHFDEFGEFSRVIAASEQISPAQVLFGVGSSEVIASAIGAFTSESKPMITASPTYDIIVQLARAMGKAVVEIPLTPPQWSYPVKQLVEEAKKAGGGMIYLCNPNNPTGSITSVEDVRWLVSNLPAATVLFVDEAYLEFADPAKVESAIKYVREDKSVVVTRTFSKIYGMAGVRAGFGCARPDLILAMNPFMDNVIPYLGVRAAMAALQEKSTLVPERRKNNARIRTELCQWLDQNKVRYIPSQANFIMIDVKRDVREFSAAMFREGVAVGRPFPPLNTMLRVTIGSAADMQRFRQAFLKVYSA